MLPHINMDFSIYSKQFNYCYLDIPHNLSIISTNVGFYVYKILPFTKIIENKFNDIILIKNKQTSNIFYFLTKYDKNILNIWDQEQEKIINKITYNNFINNIEISNNYICIFFDYYILIYDIQLNLKKKISNINLLNIYFYNVVSEIFYFMDQEKNICSVILNNNFKFVKLFNLSSSITKITVNIENTLIAIVDNDGCLIKVYNIHGKILKQKFIRGCEKTSILNIDFNKYSNYLIIHSLRGTIHLFDLTSESFLGFLPNYCISKLYLNNNNKYCYMKFFNDKLIIIDMNGSIHSVSYIKKKTFNRFKL
jgi:WD40 repeat protein